MSNDIFKCIEKLIKFNYENIYYKAYTQEEHKQIKDMLNTLFNRYIEDLNNDNRDSNIIKSYLSNLSEEYKKNTKERIVLDYIAGMTDDYCLSEYNKYLKIKHNNYEVQNEN